MTFLRPAQPCLARSLERIFEYGLRGSHPAVVRQSWLESYDVVTSDAAVTLNAYTATATRSPR